MASLVLSGALAGCGGHHAAGGPPVIKTDRWTPPAATGPPSTTKFCLLLVAAYEHLGTLPEAANLKVREQIVSDFVGIAPEVVAAAPPSISASADLYLGSVAFLLKQLDAVGLNSRKAKPGSLGDSLLDPQVQKAGAAVIDYSSRYCNYQIGG